MELPAKLTRPQDLALKLADVMGRQITVSDALMQQLQKHFSPQTLLELVATVGGLQHGVHAYGWDRLEYERTGIAQRDKTWTGAGIDIDPLIAQVCAFDHHVGAALRLIRAFGLRRKDAVVMGPNACVMPISATGLPVTRKKAETFLWVCQGSKGGRPRHVPIATGEQQEALAFAQAVAGGGDAHVSDPDRLLHQNLNHFSYVLRRFGLSVKDRGATVHGLRHELFVQVWREQTGLGEGLQALPGRKFEELSHAAPAH